MADWNRYCKDAGQWTWNADAAHTNGSQRASDQSKFECNQYGPEFGVSQPASLLHVE